MTDALEFAKHWRLGEIQQVQGGRLVGRRRYTSKNTRNLSHFGDVPAVILGEVKAFTEVVRVCTTSLFADGAGLFARAEADGSFRV